MRVQETQIILADARYVHANRTCNSNVCPQVKIWDDSFAQVTLQYGRRKLAIDTQELPGMPARGSFEHMSMENIFAAAMAVSQAMDNSLHRRLEIPFDSIAAMQWNESTGALRLELMDTSKLAFSRVSKGKSTPCDDWSTARAASTCRFLTLHLSGSKKFIRERLLSDAEPGVSIRSIINRPFAQLPCP